MTAPSTKTTAIAAAVVVCWLLGTTIGHWTDVRLTIAAVAIAGAIACLFFLPALFRRLFAPSTAHIAIGLIAAVVMVVATYVLFPVLARVDPSLGSDTRSLYALMRVPHATIPILLIVALIVVGEEVLWRGVVQEALQSRLRPALSVLMSAVVYGLSHAPIGSPLLVIVAVICGVYWSTLRNRSGSLWPSLIAHLIWDMSILTHPLVKI